MVKQALAAHPKWGYLDPAWIMSIMDIESGYNPLAGPNGAGRYDGLMQVIPSTASEMSTLYDIPSGPQTDPMTSILSGTATLDNYARNIIKALNTVSLPLWTLAKAYNGGWRNLIPGSTPSASWLAAVARYLAKFEVELPIVEAQMAATAALANRPSFAPRRVRSVMPLSVKTPPPTVTTIKFEHLGTLSSHSMPIIVEP
jgi:soluble lytic murein transglycosylase-like protein